MLTITYNLCYFAVESETVYNIICLTLKFTLTCGYLWGHLCRLVTPGVGTGFPCAVLVSIGRWAWQLSTAGSAPRGPPCCAGTVLRYGIIAQDNICTFLMRVSVATKHLCITKMLYSLSHLTKRRRKKKQIESGFPFFSSTLSRCPVTLVNKSYTFLTRWWLRFANKSF